MKKIYSILAGFLLTASLFSQVPQKMSYQAVIRNDSGALITSALVGMKISILQGSATGTPVYEETQTPNTNANGLVSLEIGNGTVVTGTFSKIEWGKGPYFIKTETDPTGGTDYTITGTSELLSVPYALFSANPGPPGPTGLTGPQGPQGPIGGFTHYLGEDFGGGIIFYLYKGSDGLEHGLIVAPTESTYQWQTIGTLVGSNNTEDGAGNTYKMKGKGSPAADYVNELYKELDKNLDQNLDVTDWYLPSINELSLLYYNRYSAQKGLRKKTGSTLLAEQDSYWSSSEYISSSANVFDFYVGHPIRTTYKTYYNIVRAIRAFPKPKTN